MEAFCELFFDNLATLLGVTTQAMLVGNLAGSLSYASATGLFKNTVTSEWTRIYYEWNIPACGLGLLFGNIWFAWLATRLATKENRLDVTAQPYGLNTTVIYITIYAISLPALNAGVTKYNPGDSASDADSIAMGKKAAEYGWKVSVAANFVIGFMEILGCFLGDIIRNTVPTAAVYVPLAGVGFVWLAFSPMLTLVKAPMMCLLPFMVVVFGFFGNVRYPVYGKVTFPIALLAILMSVIFGWAGACKRSTEVLGGAYGGDDGVSVSDFYNGFRAISGTGSSGTCQGTDKAAAKAAWKTYAFKGDIYGGFGKGLAGLSESELMEDFAAPALLFGMVGFLGTMTCVESAEAAGDAYPMSEIMIVDGIGTCMAALAGGMFGTTVYIGHPVHKALGAKIGYSMLNGIAYFIFLSTGLFACLYNVIPECASGAILVFVGLLLARQGFEETPERHYPCILLGIMPLHLQLGLARVRRQRQQEHGRSHARPLRRHRAGYHPRRAHRVGHRSQVRGGDHLLHRLRVPFPLRHRVLPQRSRLLLRSVGRRAPVPRRLRRRLRRQQGIRKPRGGLQRLALVRRLLHGRLLLRPPHPLPEGQQVHQV